MGYYRNGGDWNRGMAVAVKEVESKGPGMKQLRKDLKALECENNLSMCHQELPDGEEGRWQRGGSWGAERSARRETGCPGSLGKPVF